MPRKTATPLSTPEADPRAELERLALELDLTAIPSALSELATWAEAESPSYTAFGHAMLNTEWRVRRERKLARALKRARLGTVEGLDGFDFSLRSKLEAAVVRELATCRFVEEHRNVICVGKPGLGKTRVVKALAHAACMRGHSVLYTVTAEMIEDIHAAFADRTHGRARRRYIKPDVLVLEEFGYLPIDARAADTLFRIVSARHGQGSIILAANTGFTKWKDFFPSEAQAVATVDRLIDRATILRFTGEKSSRQPLAIHGAELDE